jgi:hypothetical protein
MGSNSFKNPIQPIKRALIRIGEFRVHHHRFIQFFLIAALIRVIVMPFFGHIDFLSEYRRIFHAWDTCYIFPGSRFITSIVELINFTVVAPLLAEKGSMFQSVNWVETTASHMEYFGFVTHHAILRTFFLLKIPYLVCDMATGFIIYRFFEDKKTALLASFIWFFNPITFFASYIFARYESIPLMFVAGSFLMLKRQRMVSAAVFLGLAMWSREIVITLFPFYIVYFYRNLLHKRRTLIVCFSLLLIFVGFASNFLPNILGFPKMADDAGGTVNVIGASQSLQLLGFQIGYFYAFVIAYVLLFLHFLFSKKNNLDLLIQTVAIYYCAFFICSVHKVHYVAWGFVPFTLLAAKNKSFGKALGIFCLVWIAFWAIASDLGVFTHWLAIPSSLFWSNIPIIPSILELVILKDSDLTLRIAIYAGRSVYAASLLFMIILAIKTRFRSTEPSI